MLNELIWKHLNLTENVSIFAHHSLLVRHPPNAKNGGGIPQAVASEVQTSTCSVIQLVSTHV